MLDADVNPPRSTGRAGPPRDGGVPRRRVPLLRRLGRFAAARRRWVLVAGLLVTLLAGAFGAGTQRELSLSRFEAPGSESVRAADVLREQFGTGNPNMVLLVTAKNGTVDSPDVARAGRALTAELTAQAGVAQAGSYWSRGSSPALRSDDARQALVVGWLPGGATETRAALAELSPRFTREDATVRVEVGGQDEVFRQVGEQARKDFVRAELVILPLVLLLLLLVYRRLIAAVLTIGVGLFSVLATMAVLRGVTAFTEVSTFAANLTLVMGLALGIDYSLFVIARFREELAAGRDVPAAVEHAVEAAGRTVIFSGVTVAVSLSVLLAFPFPFLRSFAYAGVTVVLAAVLGAVVLLPAALAALGRRVERRPRAAPAVTASAGGQPTAVPHGGQATAALAGGQGFWHRAALRVMRRPVVYGGVGLVVLLALGAPFLGVRFGLPDERVLPADASSRVVQEQIRAGFAAEETDAIKVVAPAVGDPADRRADIERYAAELSRVPGVFQVDSVAGSFADGRRTLPPNGDSDRFGSATATWLSAVPEQRALSGDVPALVGQIRALDAPFPVLVGGFPAELTDFRDSLLDRVPLVAALILLVTFVILFLMTGSLLIPAKATVLNVLSLSVLFGTLVWGFQDGHLAGLLDFTPTGVMEPSIPILMFCVAYGLSMDYEVFVMSRIKEEYDRTGDNTYAVAAGIERSAPLVTAAAAILAVSFAAYATGRVVFLQEMGVGMALAVLVDATIIRAVLVPAFMRLAGQANWWAPRPLRRLHDRIGLSEAVPPPVNSPAAT